MRLFLLILAAVLAAALLVGVLAPRVMLADGAAPAGQAQPATGVVTGRLGTGGGAGRLWTGTVGPAQVLLGECVELPCLLELDIGGRAGYLIVDYPNPRG